MKTTYRLFYADKFEDADGFDNMSSRLHYLLSEGYSEVKVKIVRT